MPSPSVVSVWPLFRVLCVGLIEDRFWHAKNELVSFSSLSFTSLQPSHPLLSFSPRSLFHPHHYLLIYIAHLSLFFSLSFSQSLILSHVNQNQDPSPSQSLSSPSTVSSPSEFVLLALSSHPSVFESRRSPLSLLFAARLAFSFFPLFFFFVITLMSYQSLFSSSHSFSVLSKLFSLSFSPSLRPLRPRHHQRVRVSRD